MKHLNLNSLKQFPEYNHYTPSRNTNKNAVKRLLLKFRNEACNLVNPIYYRSWIRLNWRYCRCFMAQ